MINPVLSVENFEKSFAGFQAVAGVSFTVAAGEMVVLIGPNGAGKTTTFNMINGQTPIDRGTVLLEGRDVTGKSPRELWREGVGRTFQITAAFVSMTVAENVAIALIARDGHLSNLDNAARVHHAEALLLLGEVGMRDAAGKICGTLAYGDLKRVELAMALASRPRLLLMDEPTAGMAPRERSQLMTLAAGIARERGTAVLFTEHDMDVVFGYAARILVMNRGRLVAEGTPDAIRNNAKVREVYLGTGGRGIGKR